MTTTPADRTHADVQRDLKTKRNLLVLAMGNLSEYREGVRRAQAHVALLEAQILALATEDAEFDRRARNASQTPLPPDYKPSIFDPSREVASGGGCGEARAMVVTA